MVQYPDYGLRLIADGYDSPDVEHYFYQLPIRGFDALGRPGQYTMTVVTTYEGEPHCLSLDFGPAPLATILTELSSDIRQSIDTELERDPHTAKQFNCPQPVLCDSLSATLGKLQHGHNERFVPLNVRTLTVRADA